MKKIDASTQSSDVSVSKASKPTLEDTNNFKLFYAGVSGFFRLDTRSGVITLLNVGLHDFEEKPFNPVPLVPENEQIPGRFNIIWNDSLSKSSSEYNKWDILLDQISGKVWILNELKNRLLL